MQELNLPAYEYKLSSDKTKIFDTVRKKYVELLPEEWVRQHFLNYLISHLKYPPSLIKVEFGIKYNKLVKRPDILAYDRNAEPLMLIECKSMDVKISKSLFQQISVYNKILNAPYAVVTNGLQHFCWKQDQNSGKIEFLDGIPEFIEIV